MKNDITRNMNHFDFIKWIPHDNVDTVYDMKDIGWTSEGFVLTLFPDNLNHHERSKYHLKMVWSDVLCYQVTQESYRPDVWIDAPEKAWAFYVTQSSKYLQEFKKDNPLVPENVYHFLVGGTNFVIDVLSDEYPTIKLIG